MFDAMETQVKDKAANQFVDCRPCKKRRKRAWKRSSVAEDLRLYPCHACELFKGKSDRAGYRYGTYIARMICHSVSYHFCLVHLSIQLFLSHWKTVDESNPAPPVSYETFMKNWDILQNRHG